MKDEFLSLKLFGPGELGPLVKKYRKVRRKSKRKADADQKPRGKM
jgi:hypothetical protein